VAAAAGCLNGAGAAVPQHPVTVAVQWSKPAAIAVYGLPLPLPGPRGLPSAIPSASARALPLPLAVVSAKRGRRPACEATPGVTLVAIICLDPSDASSALPADIRYRAARSAPAIETPSPAAPLRSRTSTSLARRFPANLEEPRSTLSGCRKHRYRRIWAALSGLVGSRSVRAAAGPDHHGR
jgi:hypothetical protein